LHSYGQATATSQRKPLTSAFAILAAKVATSTAIKEDIAMGKYGFGRELDNLSGKTFGIWKVLEFDHMKWNGANHKHGMSYYKCECQKCGRVLLIARSGLLQSKNSRHEGECT
jgi:hypothetical protein